MMTICEGMKITCEWSFFDERDCLVYGPWTNDISPAGIALVAQAISAFTGVYLAVGDDSAAGFTMTEVFRKAVSTVNASAALVRFRTVLKPDECNGTHTKASIFIGGTAVADTGTMFNLLSKTWSKDISEYLTVEAKVTIEAVSA